LNKKLAILLLAAALLFAAFSTMPALTVKADTSEVSILSYSWYFSTYDSPLSLYSGDVIIVGEIQNVGSHIIDYAVVEGNAFNASGLLATRDVRVIANNILPGEKSPFYIDISPINLDPPLSDESPTNWLPSVDHISVSVLAVSDTTQTRYADLTLSNQAGSLDSSSGLYTVSGNVINTGSQTANIIQVLATFYNSSGGVIAVNNYVSTVGSLGPGASTHFSVVPIDDDGTLSGQITTYSLMVLSTVGSTPTPTATQQPTSVPTSPSNSATPTSPSNPTPTPASIPLTDILLIVVILVAVAVLAVVALMIVKVRRKNTHATPKSPSPP
jgi:hypothetical protein